MTVQLLSVMTNSMNFLFQNRWMRTIILAVSLFTLLGATACGGKSTKSDAAPTERRTLQTNTPAPTPEILKDSPCGNPDWAKPPGSQGEEPVDQDFRATSRKKSSNDEEDEETKPAQAAEESTEPKSPDSAD